MPKLPQLEDALSKAGNLKNVYHKQIKEQGDAKLEALGLKRTPAGEFAIPIAEADGKTVYWRVKGVITLKDPFTEDKKTKTMEEMTPDLPKLI